MCCEEKSKGQDLGSNTPLGFTFLVPVTSVVCNQPGLLTFFSFGACPHAFSGMLLSDQIDSSLCQIQQAAQTERFYLAGAV